MPRICWFHGIAIAMYYNDHEPPHFHAVSRGYEARIAIADGEVQVGRLPVRSLRLVRRWSRLHRTELEVNWAKARAGLPLDTIEPLP